MPWLKKELIDRGIKTEIPKLPESWRPDYDKFKTGFEQYEVNEQTVLVGHSCGCVFLVRWLGETKQRVAKLILVAPWKIAEDEAGREFYDYEIDDSIRERVAEIVIFTADDEDDDGKASVKIFEEALGGRVVELAGRGHYTLEDIGTEQFPELLELIVD